MQFGDTFRCKFEKDHENKILVLQAQPTQIVYYDRSSLGSTDDYTAEAIPWSNTVGDEGPGKILKYTGCVRKNYMIWF